MKSASNGPNSPSGPDARRLRVADLADPAAAEAALEAWDEVEPAVLQALESHPHHGPRLARLRRAEGWLGRRGSLELADPCPTAEELYDYGRGPGYGPLPSARRAQIEDHLAGCEDCDALVATLASPPPVPLDAPERAPRIAPPARAVPPTPSPILTGPAGLPAGRSGRPRLLPKLVPLAVAAALIVALAIWIGLLPTRPQSLTFPQAPLLRGSRGGPLWFPREKVLEPSAEAARAFPGLGAEIAFEIEPQADATAYEIELARHGGDPFAADGEVLARLSGEAPVVRATLDLSPGSYTWTARAVVRGLSVELGSRDFEVVEDAKLGSALAALEGRAEPERSLEAVRLLHEFGDVTAARAIARSMPAGAERDAYLSRVPGR